jgi:hypothetical protein
MTPEVPSYVMAVLGLVPGINPAISVGEAAALRTGMAGTGPAMTR